MKNNSNNTDPFDVKKFKKGIAHVESSGGKHLWNKTSSATGKYQFLYNNLKDLKIMKGITRKQFMENSDLQEKVMDMAVKGKLKGRPGYFRNANDLTNEYSQRLGENWNYRKDEVAAISHFLGRQGARNYFNSILSGKDYKVDGKVNLKVSDYLKKYNSVIDSNQDIPKELMFNNQTKENSLSIKPIEGLLQKQDNTNINQFNKGFDNQLTQKLDVQPPNLENIQQQPLQQSTQTQAQFLDNYLGSNEFALGGGLNNNNMNNLFNEGGNLLTEFNNGGTHEENPMGGIPQGIGQNGQPNLVEEGETKTEDYVFSNRLTLNKEIVKQFNLPNNVTNKTVAEASKIINSYSEESNKSIDKETTKENLERLKSANELLKEVSQMMNPQENSFEGGGFMDFMSKNGDTMGGMLGGLGNGTNSTGEGIAKGALSMGANALLPGSGALVDPLWEIGEGLIGGNSKQLKQDNIGTSSYFNNINNQFALGGNIDPEYPQDPNELIKSIKSNKEGINYQNPYPNRSNRWQTFDTYQSGLKRRSGGSGGGDLSNNRVVNKAGENSTVTFNGQSMNNTEINKVLANRNQNPLQDMNLIQNSVNESISTNNFYNGGDTDPIKPKGHMNFGKKVGIEQFLNIPQSGINFQQEDDNFMRDSMEGSPYSQQYKQEVFPTLNDTRKKQSLNDIRKKQSLNDAKKYSGDVNNNSKSESFWDKLNKSASKTGDFLNNNSEMLRYAPTAMNAYQLATLKKPEVESLNRIDKRYKPNYVDEAQMTNQVNEQYAGTAERIANASNGSTGSLRASLLGAQLNQTKALSNAFMQSENINRQQDNTAQQFNLNVDGINLRQDTQEKDWNARNRAAYDNNKSKLLGQIGNNLGGVGLEQLRKKYPELMGMDYDILAKFIQEVSKNKTKNNE